MHNNVRKVRCPKCWRVLPEPPDVSVYECGGCGAKLQAKKRNNSTIDTTTQRLDDEEAGSSSNQESLLNSTHESDDTRDHNDVYSTSKDQDAGKIAENGLVDASETVVIENSSEKMDIKQLSDDQEPCSSSNPQSVPNSSDEHDENIEISGHEDSKSSPDNNAVDSMNELDQNNDHNRVDRLDTRFASGKNETEVEDSGSEYEEVVANTRIVTDSVGVHSKSSFKRVIAEKLLDTRSKRAAYPDENELLSEDESADLHRRRRFDRVSSVETMETARYNGTSCYGYEGSVSSLDRNDDETETPRKNHISSGNRFRFRQRNEFHPLNEHRATDVRSLYGLNKIKNNLGGMELLKLVQELQYQLYRTNISNPQQAPSYSHRTAFSGDPTAVNRLRDSSFCHHCYPRDRHFSAQLPSHHHICYNTRFSGSSSPVNNHSESEYDHRKRFRSPNKKRFVRPIASGSPWITCYRCSNLLQLPETFLVLNKRRHSLKCGACYKVLTFTLSNGTRVSRYYPEESLAAPPSSEVEAFDKPVSCSDRSFEKSYSTETDRNGSREFSVERRKTTMLKNPTRTTNHSGRRQTASEIEEVRPPRSGFPLHRLMGYDSPSKVIRD